MENIPITPLADRVLIQAFIIFKYGANTVEVEGKEYVLASETEILGIIN